MMERGAIAHDWIRETADRLFDRDVMENYARPHYVETMVGHALGPAWRFVGAGWTGWDFEHAGTRLELKQSAQRQTWSRPRGLETRGSFGIQSKKGYFTDDGAVFVPLSPPARPAQIYVFAWNGRFRRSDEPGNEPVVDHRDPAQWTFFVMPEADLPNTSTIGLTTLVRLWKSRTGTETGLTVAELGTHVDTLATRLADAGNRRPEISTT